MVSIIRRVYQTCSNWLRGSAFQFSDTTRWIFWWKHGRQVALPQRVRVSGHYARESQSSTSKRSARSVKRMPLDFTS